MENGPLPDAKYSARAVAEELGGSAIEVKGDAMTGTAQFDALIGPYHDALRAIINGDPGGYKAMYSEEGDVTLANPFGGVARGRAEVEERLDGAAANYREGEIASIDTVAKLVTSELAYLVEIERYQAKVGDSDEFSPSGLRVTSVFRPEGEGWRLVHRHADPAIGPRPAETVIQP
jgi:ketosteroid isomerase-like protein